MTTDGITITVAEMPRNCYECPFCVCGTIYTPANGEQEGYYYDCFLTYEIGAENERRKDCPLTLKKTADKWKEVIDDI